jgi:hypothetical protein
MVFTSRFSGVAALTLVLLAPVRSLAQVTPAPTSADWSRLAKQPDWSGVWTPDITHQRAEDRSHPPPWNARASAEIARLTAEQAAGRPKALFVNCLPHGMPAWMLTSHNALEILFTPGRVTMLGEVDGNRLRRIYTDGRPHPPDADPTFHGHSIGRWEGDTLVVDTVAIRPQTFIALGEGIGIPNNGNMHIVERIRLESPDVLVDELQITAPQVLTAPWKTVRRFYRQRNQRYDIVEGVCLEGSFLEETDANGNAIFVPDPQAPDGTPLPATAKTP